MEIKITRHSNRILLEQYRALWQLIQDNRSLTETLFPILSLVLGSIFILISLAEFQMGKAFWSPACLLGIFFIIASCVFYFIKYNQKKTFLSKAYQIVHEYERNQNVTEISLCESTIKIRDFQSYHEIEWKAFKNIRSTKDYFFFLIDKSYQNGFVISKSELRDFEVQEIIKHIGLLPNKFK